MDSYQNKRRKYDIEDINELLEKNIELASHIHVEVDKCIHPMVLKWLQNYNHLTSGQTLSLYYALINTAAHLSMESTVMQWNQIARYLNLYSIILGFSGVTKSGCVRECREALEELYQFLLMNNIGNPNAVNSIIDKFTEAGFLDQLKESTNILVIQEEVDVVLKQMSFFSNNPADSNRQLFCQLFDGLTMTKKTKGYRLKIRNARMTVCGTSTGVLLPPVLQDYLKHVMTDGADVRCLFLVLPYRPYLREHHIDPNLNLPTIAQMLMAIVALGKRQYIYTEQAQVILDNYIKGISEQTTEIDSKRIKSFLAKQASQVTRITALVQIIDLLPLIFEDIHIERELNDTIGLSIQLFYDIDNAIRRLFGPQITINETSTTRAVYFHGYLLEQTLKIFDVTSLETTAPRTNHMTTSEMKQSLIRQILMLSKIIITKEDLYANNDNKKIDRSIGTQAFELLVDDGLLHKDYFVLTNTYRPIQCYAKVLPANQIDRELIGNKLQSYNIQLSDYLEASRSIGIQLPSRLSLTGKRLFTQNPYSKLCDITMSLSQSSLNNSLTTSTSSNNSFSLTSQTVNQTESHNQLNQRSLLSLSFTQQNRHKYRNFIVKRNNTTINNLSTQQYDMADDDDIITTNELLPL